MEAVNEQLSRYVQPTIIILGTIGAILNQVLFYLRKPLRSTSCTWYFRSLSANDLLVLYLVMLSEWLADQFNIDPSTQYNWCCKLKMYFTITLYTLSPYFLVLACFDRLCTSSTNAKLRRLATVRVASFLIPSIIISIFTYYSYVLVWCQIVSTPFSSYCTIINPTYSRFFVFSLLIFFCFIPPILMIIFCSITLILLRQQRHRIMPINQARLRHRDNQLLKMLLIYVTSNIVCVAPFAVTYFMESYYFNNPSPFNSTLVQTFNFLVNVNYATSFYVYTLGTPFYRDELFNLVRTIRQRFRPVDNTNFNIQQRGTTNGSRV